MTITRYDIASNNCISFEPVGLTEGDSFSPHPLPLPHKFFAHLDSPACWLGCSISPPGKGKETAATQATYYM